MGRGRTKTGTTKIEDNKSLMASFSKRLPSFVKKAYEMGTLSGVDVALLVFSPSGKLIPFSINSRMEDIIAKFINLPDDKRGLRIENQGHLLETLERIKHENIALVLQQTASSSSSNSNIDNSKIEELQTTITKLENKRDALQQHLRKFTCDNGAPMTEQSFKLRQDMILTALAHVKERKQQIHLQHQQLFSVPMQQELPYDFHQNNFGNSPVLQPALQTTLRTQQNCSKNNNELFAVVENYCGGGSFSGQVTERHNPDGVFKPMSFAGFSARSSSSQVAEQQNPDGVFEPLGFASFSGGSFHGQVAKRQNPGGAFQTMGFAGFGRGSFSGQVEEQQNPGVVFEFVGFVGFNGGSFRGQVAERQNPGVVFEPMGLTGFNGGSFRGQVAERQNPDTIIEPIGFAGFKGGSFSGQVAERQNPGVVFEPLDFAGFNGGSFTGQIAEQQNPVEIWDHKISLPMNCWSNPPCEFHQSDHTH